MQALTISRVLRLVNTAGECKHYKKVQLLFILELQIFLYVAANHFLITSCYIVLGGDHLVLRFNARGKIIENVFCSFRRNLLSLRLSVNKSIFIVDQSPLLLFFSLYFVIVVV